jgi:hypothetical protein
MCAAVWQDRSCFLRDASLKLNGYQADFQKLENGLFYFTHNVDGCYSTMAITANTFFDLNTGRRYKKPMNSSEKCPGYCMKTDQLDRCSVECEYAFVRDIIDIIEKFKNN